MIKGVLLTSFLVFVSGATMFAEAAEEQALQLNLHSYRQPFLIQPLMDAFTEETGTKVNLAYAKRACWSASRRKARARPRAWCSRSTSDV
jgi:iron(III) transport system substrate-binding protein